MEWLKSCSRVVLRKIDGRAGDEEVRARTGRVRHVTYPINCGHLLHLLLSIVKTRAVLWKKDRILFFRRQLVFVTSHHVSSYCRCKE